jgi:DNA polymerase III subunit delta'
MGPAELQSFRLAERAPWLAPARAQVALAIGAGRLPHALLLQGQPGLGKAALADWVARLALCEAPAAGPCGACTSCRLHAAGTHPDLRRVGLVEDKKQIAVEDIRELIASLALKSYRGRRKAAIVDPADALNASGANALLKTLEEPSAGALLVLTVARPERLPATIASRCQRLKIAPPAREAALAWLAEVDPAPDWAGPLSLAAGAPVAALRLVAAGASDLEREMAELPGLLARPDADLVGLAERCQQRLPGERLRWIENWVTERIRRGLLAPAPDHSPGNPGLPAAARTRHIQGLYEILDETRAAQAALKGSANVTLLFERLLLRLARELETLRAGRARG